MKAVVAVDGGGSKTDVMVVSLDGDVLAHVRGDSHLPQVIGARESIGHVTGYIRQACAGITDLDIVHVGAYLSGADLPEEIAALEAEIEAAAWAPSFTLDNDTFALLRIGTSSPDAIAVVCGTGLNCVGVRADGNVARFPSLGRVSGDWGGGGDIGMEAMFLAVRAEEGRGPATGLVEAILTATGASTMYELAADLHLQRRPSSLVAALAPLVFDVADAGDEAARSVVARQADEVVAFALTAAKKLQFRADGPAIPLVLGGSVLAARRQLLSNRIDELLAVAELRLDPVVVDAPPINGAVLLALDHVLHASADHVFPRQRAAS